MKQHTWALATVLFLFGCSSSPVEETRVDAPLVEGQYKLAADREAFADLRKQVPEETKIQNDESAFLEQLMADPSRPPARVREMFHAELSKKRSQFNKDLERRRTDFVRQERSDREAFQKQQEGARKDLRDQKMDLEIRRKAFADLEQKRKDFYQSQRERRDGFEADQRDRRKNFEDYHRQISADFNQAFKNFQARHQENQKAKEQNLREQADGFKKMDQVPVAPLGTGE